MKESKHTPGPWVFEPYPYPEEEVEKRRNLGMEPIRMLTNEGQAPIMGGSREEEDRRRVAVVDCQADYKRGQGYKSECEERDANARLIALAPTMYEYVKAKAEAGDTEAARILDGMK
jgi:hypothetical protein